MRTLKLTVTTFFFALISVNVFPQRYLSEITDSVYVETYTYAVKDSEELAFDIYLPAFDNEQSKVTMLYVHGGGFSSGNRDAGKEFCINLAKRGFAAVTMSYRLTRKGTKTKFGCDCTVQDKLKAFSSSKEDILDATHFLIERREQFGINPHKIILSGSSAGAEAVLNTAFEPPYCYNLDSGPVSYGGVIGMAGAIPNIDKIYDESAVPAMFFHGNCDNLVPYSSQPHHYCPEDSPGYLILHGGYSLAEKLRELGKPYWLVTICGGNHSWSGRPRSEYFNEIIDFCYDFVIKEKKEQRHTIVPGDQTKCTYPQFNFCE